MERGSGVRYITEDLLLRISKVSSVDAISKLNLTLSREGGKKIRYIENLEKCKALQSLNLSCNMIEKIEKLERLTRLRELNLSHNHLSRLEGLETLVSLQVLDVGDNNISIIPGWLPKRLKSLQTFRINQNAIESLTEISKLHTLTDLVQVSVADNPVCRLPHHRLFIVFHLVSLQFLDGQAVNDDERESARARFDMEEVARLTVDLEERERRVTELEDRRQKAEADAKVRTERERELHRKQRQDIEKISMLERELEAKDNLLKTKSDELTRACHKHYELEQELAFYKIDAKFDTLGRPPPLSSEDLEPVDGTGESPYIGKGRMSSVRQPGHSGAPQAAAMGRAVTRESATSPLAWDGMEAGAAEPEDRRQVEAKHRLSQALDRQLLEKRGAIEEAQSRLDGLQQDLQHTEEGVVRASQELERLIRASSASLSPPVGGGAALSDGEKSALRSDLARKIGRVSRLREDAELLRSQMDQTEAEMRRQQEDMDAVHHQLSRLHQTEPLAAELQRQMVDKGQQLSQQNEAYNDLQAQMEMLLDTIQKEAEAVRDLEARLQAGPDDNLREELEGVVSGLQDYLVNMRSQADAQRQKLDGVLRERDQLRRELAEARQEMGEELKVEKASRQDIVRRLTRLEAELEAERRANTELQTELQEVDLAEEERLRDAGAAESRLATAEDQIDELKDALMRLRDDAESERAEMEAALAAERRRAAARAHAPARDERDSGPSRKELEALRRSNQQLQRQVENQRQYMLSPEDVTRKVRDMVTDIRRGQPPNTSGQGDYLSRSLGELAQILEGRSGGGPPSGAATPGAKSDAEVQQLRAKLEHAEKLEGQSDQGAQAEVLLSMIEDSKRTYNEEMDKMKDQIGRLQNALESVRVRPSQTLQLQSMLSNVEEEEDSDGEPVIVPRGSPANRRSPNANSPTRQRVLTRTRPRKAGGEDSTEDEAPERRPPLPWKKSMYDTLSSDEQGMFEELNTELGRIRRQMETIETSNANKLEDALERIQELQGEIHQRDEEAKAAERLRERGEWEKQLNSTFAELDQAQEQIMDLQRNLEEREQAMEVGLQSQDKSNDRINMQQQEIGQLKDILDAQRQEILRLNDLLDRLNGLNPAETNRMELERIQADIGALRASVAAQTNPAFHASGRMSQAWSQPHQASPNPLARSSPFVGHPSAAAPAYMPPYPPSASPMAHPFSASPAVGYASPNLAGSLPPMMHMADEEEFRRQRLGTSGERNSLLCNVPEHHRLEDYLQGLQEKLTGMKRRLKEKRRSDHEAELAILRRLRGDIEEKKEELEETEFAVERQRAAFERLQQQEQTVVEAARQEMERVKAEVARGRRELSNAQTREAVEEVEAELEAGAAQRQFLKEEIACLSETLAKRRVELGHVEKQLASANSELAEVKSEARETICRYDEARLGHERTVQESEELERRAKEALTELARTTNDARDLRAEVLGLEANKRDLELTLNEIQQVITNKDAEYQTLNQGVRQTAENLSKLQQELSVTMEQGREKLDLIHEEEQLLADKRAELDKLRHQMESERSELEQLDRLMGKRRAEDQLLAERLDKRRDELAGVTREVEKEASARQREIRDIQNTLESLREEEKQLLKTIEDHKSERAEMRDDADREQQVLQNITSAISKQKMELKHLLEMVKLEQAELAKVNEQYAERLASLERAQASLHDQRSELAEVEAARKVKAAELERCREAMAAEAAALERMQSDRRGGEASLEVVTKEKEMLAETARGLEHRQATLKKSVGLLDESIFSAQSRLDKLQAELSADEAAVSRAKAERSSLERDLAHLSQQVRDARSESQTLRERAQEFEARAEKAETEWRQRVRHRDDLQTELRRHAEQVRSAQGAREDATARATGAKEELQRIQVELSDRQGEHQEVTKTENLSRVRHELEVEESRLSRLLSSSGGELERVKRELVLKEEELETCVSRLNQLKRDTEQRQLTEEHASQLSRRISELEADARASSEEKQQLAEALNRSYKERQALREDLAKEREARESSARGAEQDADGARQQLVATQKELKKLRKRCAAEIRDLEKVAQQHCARSTRLAEDLNQARHDYLQLRKQVILFGRILENASLMSQAELADKKRRLEETLKALKLELSPTANGMQHEVEELPVVNGSAFEELCGLQDQRKLLQSHLETLKDNLTQIRAGANSRNSPASFPTMTPSPEPKLGVDADEELVKAQIRQRVNAHMDSLTSQCRRSEDNMHNLRRRLDDLEVVLGKETPPPTRDRSPFFEMQSGKGPAASMNAAEANPTLVA